MFRIFIALTWLSIATMSAILNSNRTYAQELNQPKTTVLMKKETVGAVTEKEAYFVNIEWPPGAATGRHVHSGDEFGEILDGELQLSVDGLAPRTMRAGDVYHTLPGVVHETRNISGRPAHSAAVLIINKGMPPTEPVN